MQTILNKVILYGLCRLAASLFHVSFKVKETSLPGTCWSVAEGKESCLLKLLLISTMHQCLSRFINTWTILTANNWEHSLPQLAKYVRCTQGLSWKIKSKMGRRVLGTRKRKYILIAWSRVNLFRRWHLSKDLKWVSGWGLDYLGKESFEK